jgi:putative addiction module killer protein
MFDGQPKEVIFYQTADGAKPCQDWLEDLRDRQTEARIQNRLIRLRAGNPGDYKSVGGGVYELRIDFGPGFRIYFAFAGQQLIFLLCGGDKTTQDTDIEAADRYWKDFKERELR